jgi:cell division protein FtsL
LAGIVGGLCLGALADTPRFRRSLKTFILICFIGCLLSVLWFQLSVRTVFYDNPLIRSTAITIGFSLTLAGLFQGAAAPLIYEALAEVMFPLPESLSAAVIVQWNNVACTILLFVASGRYKLINLLVLIVIALSAVMVVFARVSYKRRDEDEQKRKESILALELGESVPKSVPPASAITSKPL